MDLKNRAARIHERIEDSEALEKGKKVGGEVVKVAADGCEFAFFLFRKLVRPVTRRVRDQYREYKSTQEVK